MNELLTPTVSVAIPVYNRLRYLSATIESVLAQTMVDWELIVVDDGSQEDVAGFMAQYTDPRICFMRQANQGNAAARNAGIEQGSGEFIICLDSDDVWHPSMLETCVSFLDAYPDVDVAYTQVQATDGDGYPLPRPVGPTPHNGDLLEPLLMGYPILPSSAVVRRSSFDRWGAYTPGLDDWELWLRWAAHGCRFACIEQPLLFYRVHENNLHLNWDKRREVHFRILDAFYSAGQVPANALALRDNTYAQQHFDFAVMAWQLGRETDGVAEFAHALELRPGLAYSPAVLFRLACAHQGSPDSESRKAFDLETSERALIGSLDRVCQSPIWQAVPGSSQSGKAYSLTYLVLARLAYSYGNDIARMRAWIAESARRWPAVIWQSDWLHWAWRAILNPVAVRSRLQPSRSKVRL